MLLSTITFILHESLEDEEESAYTDILDVVDGCTMIFFTLEYFVRFISAPHKFKFLKNPMNMIDLLAIIPLYLSMAIEQLEDWEIIGKAGKTIRLVRLLRIIRIFKLVRHFAGLQALVQTLSEAYRELGLLLFLIFLSILLFAVLIYYAEKDSSPATNLDGKVSTIFKSSDDAEWSFIDSLWWCVMTQTTVGNNRNYPKTKLGQLLGGLCAVAGVFVLTLPIPIVVNSFATCYKNQMWQNEVAYNKAEQLSEAKKRLSGKLNKKQPSV